MPWRRASQPSRKSVMQATRKQRPARARLPGLGSMRRTTSTGTRPIRKAVSEFGRTATRRPRPRASATGLDTARLLAQVGEPVTEYAGQILARLWNARNAAGVLDALGAGVVRRHGQRDVAAIAVEEHAQVAAATLDVVAWEEHV